MRKTLNTLVIGEGGVFAFHLLTPETVRELTSVFTLGCQATIAIAAILKIWYDWKRSKRSEKK